MAKLKLTIHSNANFWLIAGIILSSLSQLRWGVSFLAWFAQVPFLYYLTITNGGGRWLRLFAALLITWHLAVAKIITAPIPFVLVSAYAVPSALQWMVILFAWDKLRLRTTPTTGLLLFPALVVVMEWLQFAFTPLGTWGNLANTQLGNLPLLQLLSVTGMGGVSFIMAWGMSLQYRLLVDRSATNLLRPMALFAAVLVVVFVAGSFRLANVYDGPTVPVATISSELVPIDGWPTDEELSANTDLMYARSEIAAGQGARILVWNEGATGVSMAGEPAFIERGKAFAKSHSVHLVMAYIVPLTDDEMIPFENKYMWIRPDGTVAEEYFKHYPVPGEGSAAGTEPLKAIATEFGPVAGAICYDYDFPTLGREHGKLGLGLVVVPSSDWLGIDPIHTQMASFRAIENGFSLVRSTKLAASAAFDAYGRVRGWGDYRSDLIMMAKVPTAPVKTLYTVLGDWVAYLSLLGLVVAIIRRPRRTSAQ